MRRSFIIICFILIAKLITAQGNSDIENMTIVQGNKSFFQFMMNENSYKEFIFFIEEAKDTVRVKTDSFGRIISYEDNYERFEIKYYRDSIIKKLQSNRPYYYIYPCNSFISKFELDGNRKIKSVFTKCNLAENRNSVQKEYLSSYTRLNNQYSIIEHIVSPLETVERTYTIISGENRVTQIEHHGTESYTVINFDIDKRIQLNMFRIRDPRGRGSIDCFFYYKPRQDVKSETIKLIDRFAEGIGFLEINNLESK